MIDLKARAMKAANTWLTDTKGFEVVDVFPDNEFVNIIALDEDDSLHAIRVTCHLNGLCDDDPRDFRGVAERECFNWLAAKGEDYDFVLGQVVFDCIDMVVAGKDRAFLRFHINALC